MKCHPSSSEQHSFEMMFFAKPNHVCNLLLITKEKHIDTSLSRRIAVQKSIRDYSRDVFESEHFPRSHSYTRLANLKSKDPRREHARRCHRSLSAPRQRPHATFFHLDEGFFLIALMTNERFTRNCYSNSQACNHNTRSYS